MRTAKAQTNLRNRALWSGPSLPANKIKVNTECIWEEKRSGWYFAIAQDDLNMRILRTFEGTFSLDAAHIQGHTTMKSVYVHNTHIFFMSNEGCHLLDRRLIYNGMFFPQAVILI